MASRDLTKGPIWRALAKVSAPMSFGILSVLSVGVIDAYFLGQLGGAPLAAIGFIFPVTAAFTSLAIGLSAGANAIVSQSLGKGDDPEVTARYGLHACCLGLVLAVVVAVSVWAAFPLLFGAMGAGEAVLPEIGLYMPYWSLSFPLLVLMMVINSLFRAHGNGAISAAIMVLSAVVNIALNPILIFGWGPIPALETEGAAIASAIGRGLAAVCALTLAIRWRYLDLSIAFWPDFRTSVGQLINIGAPAAFSNAINPAGMALVTAAVATLGDAAVAGFGAATRVQSVAMVAMLALSAGVGPVVGQNWGAGQEDRARAALRQCWIFSIGYGAVLALLLFAFADVLATAIASDRQAATFTRQYLVVVGFSLFGYGILVTTNAAMNARSKAVHSMGLSLMRIFAVYLPFAWIGVWTFGYPGILIATICANLFGVFGSLVAARAVGLFKTRLPLIARPAGLLPG